MTPITAGQKDNKDSPKMRVKQKRGSPCTVVSSIAIGSIIAAWPEFPKPAFHGPGPLQIYIQSPHYFSITCLARYRWRSRPFVIDGKFAKTSPGSGREKGNPLSDRCPRRSRLVAAQASTGRNMSMPSAGCRGRVNTTRLPRCSPVDSIRISPP